jgi:hypothetical protein
MQAPGEEKKDEAPAVVYPEPRTVSRYLMTRKGYLHPMKTYAWLTLFVTGLMSALWFVVGIGDSAQGTLPPAFGLGANDLYFHSIAIGLAALLVIFVVMAFGLDKYEPNLDFPIAYRATLATILGGVAGFLYLRPIFHAWFAPLPIVILFGGFLLLADVGGALLLELYLLPGKLAGRYDAKNNILGMVPRWSNLPHATDFRKMDGAYWLTFVTVAGTFIAGVMGFIAFWLQYLVVDFNVSSGLFNGYIAWMGGASALLGGAIGSHGHVIGITVIVGLVAITAKWFGVLEVGGFKRSLAKAGMWVSGIGIVVMTLTYIIEGFTQVWPNGPPLVLASNPGGPISLWSFSSANGIAGDDSTMVLASLGAMIMLIPLMLTKFRGKPAWKDPLRLAVLGTWILAYIAVPIQGLAIEFNESSWSGTPLDMAYGSQQYFALFGLAMVAAAFLAVDFFQDKDGTRKTVAWYGTIVAAFATLAGLAWTWFDSGILAADGSLPVTVTGWVYTAGLLLVSTVLIAAVVAIYRGSPEPIPVEIVQKVPVQMPIPVAKAAAPATEGG